MIYLASFRGKTRMCCLAKEVTEIVMFFGLVRHLNTLKKRNN